MKIDKNLIFTWFLTQDSNKILCESATESDLTINDKQILQMYQILDHKFNLCMHEIAIFSYCSVWLLRGLPAGKLTVIGHWLFCDPII